jgi:hypothetical protein
VARSRRSRRCAATHCRRRAVGTGLSRALDPARADRWRDLVEAARGAWR